MFINSKNDKLVCKSIICICLYFYFILLMRYFGFFVGVDKILKGGLYLKQRN